MTHQIQKEQYQLAVSLGHPFPWSLFEYKNACNKNWQHCEQEPSWDKLSEYRLKSFEE